MIIPNTIFTWLNAAAFITLVEKWMQRLFKTDHYSMLKDDVCTHDFEIDCGTNQVRRLFEVRRLTK